MGHENLSLPKNIEIEKSILGAMLMDDKAIETGLMYLKADDFYIEAHGLIFNKIIELLEKGDPVDSFTVGAEIKHKIDEEEPTAYLVSLADNITATSNVEYYIKKLKESAIQRRIFKGISDFQEGKLTKKELIEKLELSVQNKKDIIRISDKIPESLEYVDRLCSGDKEMLGISTGYRDIDDMIGGMKPGDFVVIAGRPSMGKTSLGINICLKVVQNLAAPALLFSFETLSSGLILRMLYAMSKVSESSIKSAFSPGQDKIRLQDGAKKLKELPIFICDDADLTAMEIRMRARQFKRKYPNLCLIMVDYIQQVPTEKKYENEVRQITEVSQQLNRMAKELQVPILVISQLNRSCEMRDNKRPRLSDLRGSGQLEQDADIVFLLYREFIYNRKKGDPALLECGIGKQRDGEVGKVNLTFIADEKRIENYSNKEEELF